MTELQTEASDQTAGKTRTRDRITDSEINNRIRYRHSLRITADSETIPVTVIQTAGSEITPEAI